MTKSQIATCRQYSETLFRAANLLQRHGYECAPILYQAANEWESIARHAENDPNEPPAAALDEAMGIDYAIVARKWAIP